MDALKAVAQVHQDQDRATQHYLNRTQIQPSCRKGCAFCCHAMVVVGLAEAEYLLEHLEPEVLEQSIRTGKERLVRIAQEKRSQDFATRFFLEANPCPLLLDGACRAYEVRPLACRGVLTNLDAKYCKPGATLVLKGKALDQYQAQLGQAHGPEHYLKTPWRSSEGKAQMLWQAEQKERGFTVVGELATMLYLLNQPGFVQAVQEGRSSTGAYLGSIGILGGKWGFWLS